MSDLPNMNETENTEADDRQDEDVEGHKMTHGLGPGLATGPEGAPGMQLGTEGDAPGVSLEEGEQF